MVLIVSGDLRAEKRVAATSATLAAATIPSVEEPPGDFAESQAPEDFFSRVKKPPGGFSALYFVSLLSLVILRRTIARASMERVIAYSCMLCFWRSDLLGLFLFALRAVDVDLLGPLCGLQHGIHAVWQHGSVPAGGGKPAPGPVLQHAHDALPERDQRGRVAGLHAQFAVLRLQHHHLHLVV